MKKRLNLAIPMYFYISTDIPVKTLPKKLRKKAEQDFLFFDELKNYKNDLEKVVDDLENQFDLVEDTEPLAMVSRNLHEIFVYAIFIENKPYEFYFSKEHAEKRLKGLIAPQVKIIKIPYAFNPRD